MESKIVFDLLFNEKIIRFYGTCEGEDVVGTFMRVRKAKPGIVQLNVDAESPKSDFTLHFQGFEVYLTVYDGTDIYIGLSPPEDDDDEEEEEEEDENNNGNDSDDSSESFSDYGSDDSDDSDDDSETDTASEGYQTNEEEEDD